MNRTRWLVLLVAAGVLLTGASCRRAGKPQGSPQTQISTQVGTGSSGHSATGGSPQPQTAGQTQATGVQQKAGQTQAAGQAQAQAQQPRPIESVREAAVAGLFYPNDASALGRMIDGFLAKVNEAPVENLRALVVPHAGYEYSGPIAAFSYKLLAGQDVRTVILLAPSHYAYFHGAFLPRADAYRTPLGLVRISPKTQELAKVKPLTTAPQCQVERPPWWRQSPKTAPAAGQDLPDTWEHSAEVQVPFLQRVLKDFTLVPVIYGIVDPAEVAKALEPVLDDKTVIVASSDLSHYHPYDQARQLDNQCLAAVRDMNIEAMKGQEACGKDPILTLMYLAKSKGWHVRMLDYRNSGDTSGQKGRVVGYGAVAFYAPSKTAENFSPEERKWMLELARKALKESVTAGNLPQVDPASVAAKLTDAKGCFVTLTENGALRGCVGNILPAGPLYRAIMSNAQNAALRDHRFMPVQASELDRIEIEVSVLTEPEPLDFKDSQDLLDRLQPGEDGVILKIGDRMATYLPQVWEQIPDKQEFLRSLAVKAGCAGDAWKTGPTSVAIYHVEAFKESGK
jgi:AmmeMemoRadiSam system protein B/AmmeMemoRadiSam system protein A